MPPKRIKDGNSTPAIGPGAPCTPPLWDVRARPPVSSAVVRKAPIAPATRLRTSLFAPPALPRGPAPLLGASATVLEVAGGAGGGESLGGWRNTSGQVSLGPAGEILGQLKSSLWPLPKHSLRRPKFPLPAQHWRQAKLRRLAKYSRSKFASPPRPAKQWPR